MDINLKLGELNNEHLKKANVGFSDNLPRVHLDKFFIKDYDAGITENLAENLPRKENKGMCSFHQIAKLGTLGFIYFDIIKIFLQSFFFNIATLYNLSK